MPSFSDSIFLFILALLLFGPKKLPVLARELGKWVGEFRRASNEFKMQMEEELRLSEQEDRRKQIAAMEAAAPLPAPVDEPEHPHLQPVEPSPVAAETTETGAVSPDRVVLYEDTPSEPPPDRSASVSEPLPIATSGELRMMPPATGLPIPRTRPGSPEAALQQAADVPSGNALSSLVSAIPHDESENGNRLKATSNAGS